VALAAVLLFVLAVVGGVLAHLNTPRARLLVVAEANRVLAATFRGRLIIRRVTGIWVSGVAGADATLDDPTGRRVLAVQGVHVSLATLAAARSALLDRRGPLTLRFFGIAIDSVDLSVDTDAQGALELLNAFASPPPNRNPNANARGVRVVIPRVSVRHAWVHGRPVGAPPLDTDIDGLRGAFTHGPDRMEADVANAKIRMRRIANGADVVGSLEAHVEKPTAATVPTFARIAWDGTVGAIAESIRGSLVADRIDAVVDMPEVRPDSLRTVWPASPVDRSARLHLEAHGTPAGVEVDLHTGIGEAALDATGPLVLRGEQTANVTLRARGIDLHELAPSAPRSRLGLTGQVFAKRQADGALSGDLAVRFLGGDLGHHALPSALLHAALSLSSAKELRSDAEVVVDERGAPTKLTVHVAPKGNSSTVGFQLDSSAADLQQIPELRHALSGSVRISVAGEADITKGTVEADLHANVAGLASGGTRAASASVDTRVRGSLDTPEIDAQVHSRGLVAAGLRFASAEVRAQGTARAAHVTASARGPDTPDIDAAVDLAVQGGVSLDGLRVGLARGGEKSIITARDVKVGGGALSVEDARIDGLGAPLTAAVLASPTELRVRAATRALDLARLARLAHIEKRLQGGTITFDADVGLRRGAGEGRLVLDAAHVAAGKARDASAHVAFSLGGQTAVGKVHAEIPGAAVLDLNAPRLTFGGMEAFTAEGWREVFGSVDVDAHADLAKLVALVPTGDAPVGEAQGRVALRAHLTRESADAVTPGMDLDLTTEQLVLAPPVSTERDIDGVLVHPPPAWRLAGIDFSIAGGIDGHTGLLRISTKARDATGQLAQLDATLTHLPYADVLRSAGQLTDDLRTTGLDVHLVVPERGLGSLPPILEQQYVTGRVRGNVDVAGTIVAPRVDVAATFRHASFSGNMRTPLDVDVAAHYDGQHGTGSVKARTGDGGVLDAEAQIDAVLAQILDGKGSPPPWTAAARAHMASFPLQSIATLDDKLVSGTLSGDVSVTGLHADARADAKVTVDALSVGSTRYRSANVLFKADGHVVDATVRIDQSDGFLETKGHAAESWGTAIAPALDPAQPLQASLVAKNFRIAALLPLVDGVLDELDGRIDGKTSVELDPRTQRAKLDGRLTLTQGVVEASAGGGELHDVTADLKFAPDGTVTLERLSAAALTGKLAAAATAQIEGATLKAAHGVITIPSSSPVPISAGGTALGDVDGRVEVTAKTPPGSGLLVAVEVPKMNVKLPQGASGNPQMLGPMPGNVRIGAHRGDPGQFVLVPLDPSSTDNATKNGATEKNAAATASQRSASGVTLTAHLADVHVVRGTELKVDLDGNVKVSSRAASKVTGQILLKRGGTLDVQGRKFTVETGTITFVGDDPSNPQVVVRAQWTAPDKTLVTAAFTGPLKTGKVTLSSQPQLPREEIVQLLLYGNADGKQAQSPSSSTASMALAEVGGEAAQPLNHALSQLGLGAVTAKLDTSQAANPRSDVEVQVAKDISVQLAIVLGQPPPGVNPDTTLLTLDWRFITNWSLSTTVGNAGTTIFDLLWQHRY